LSEPESPASPPAPDAPAGAAPAAKTAAPPPPPPPELLPALVLFDGGDLRGADAAARALLAGKPAPEVEEAARGLLARLAPDPWALRLGVLAAGLLALLCGLYVF
jgi:hypothetical protein